MGIINKLFGNKKKPQDNKASASTCTQKGLNKPNPPSIPNRTYLQRYPNKANGVSYRGLNTSLPFPASALNWDDEIAASNENRKRIDAWDEAVKKRIKMITGSYGPSGP